MNPRTAKTSKKVTMASRVPGLRIKSKKTSNVAAATKMGTMDSSMSRMLQYFLQLGSFFVHLRKGSVFNQPHLPFCMFSST